MAKKITPEQYEQWLAENRPMVTVLEPRSGSTRKLRRHQCGICHHVWGAHIWNHQAG